MRPHLVSGLFLASCLLATAPHASADDDFVNWESPHVHPLDLTQDGNTLLAVNTPDNRLEVIDVSAGKLEWIGSIPVGLDPVSVRVRNGTEAWVVNHISDSVSIIDLTTLRLMATLPTADEPCDVVFAGSPERAFVSCSQVNQVQVFDPNSLGTAPQVVTLEGEDPRALAVSNDGATVYAAIFDSGNRTTVLGGGAAMAGGFPPNVVNHISGPYGGQNPPPNSGGFFSPAINPMLPTPPRVALIVREDGSGNWLDDNSGDWTDMVSGANAHRSGRPVGWNLPDHDVAAIDVSTLSVSYADHLMNLNMALAVHPTSDEIIVVGTDATNEIRFEPNLKGTFVRVQMARVDDGTLASLAIDDLNGHLDYTTGTLAQSERDKSIGDPRGIAWNPAGTRGYVSGMGSNNLIVIDASGARIGLAPTIEVGEGPTGLVHHPTADRLFVLNKFAGSISEVNTVSELDSACVVFHDPSDDAIRLGRKHLYGTHETSGLGQASCASCHIDARMDRLAWDLGDPTGEMKDHTHQNLGANLPGANTGFQKWHPMKGPMTTQTLQDIIGKEPHHWRGDRDGIEEFAAAFVGLLGDDVELAPGDMQEFEDMLATIFFPPNPFRNLDNSLPTNLPLTGHVSSGRFSPKGTALPNGNAVNGLSSYRFNNLDASALNCSTCHTLPTGLGTDTTLVGATFQPIPPGPNGERHHALVSVDGTTNVTTKIPHLRNLYDKVGFDTSQTSNVAGFGFLHDGTIDTIAQFVSEPVFSVSSDQEVADLVALMLAFSGSELPYGGLLEPPGTASQDAHAAVGAQTTVIDGSNPTPGQFALIATMKAEADQGDVGLVVKGRQGGIERGYTYVGAGQFQSDRLAESMAFATLQTAASVGNELTWSVVPKGSETRIGIDRDADGAFDRDELDAGSDPADEFWLPGCGNLLAYGQGCAGTGGIVPTLSLGGCMSIGGTGTLDIRKGLGGGTAFIVAGNTQAAVPIGGGCTLNVLPFLQLFGPFTLGTGATPTPGGPGQGSFHQQFSVPPTAFPGSNINLQVIIQDTGNPRGLTTSNGVELQFL